MERSDSHQAAGPVSRERSLFRVALHTFGGLLLFLLLVMGLSALLREDLEALGRLFVARFGLIGMFVGTWLADALSFPIPPQFYLLTAHIGGAPAAPAVLSVAAASVLAGHCGYHLAERLGRLPLLRRRIARSRERLRPLFTRSGFSAAAIGTLMPLPFSVMCYAAGAYRAPYGPFALFTLLRVPRILFYYLIIRGGWG